MSSLSTLKNYKRDYFGSEISAMLADLPAPNDYEELVGKGTEFIQKL